MAAGVEGAADGRFSCAGDSAGAAGRYLNWRKLSIFGGTNEIQRNIIAKMMVGL